MKRLTAAMMAGAVAVLLTASSSEAQYVFLGGGASIPMSDFKDIAKTGWIATAGLGYDIGTSGLFVEAEGFYGSNKHKAPSADDKTNLLIGLGALGYSFMPEKSVRPYVLAGIGFLRHQFDPATGDSESSTDFAYSGAVGLSFKAGAKLNLWLEARYIGGDTKLLPIMGGVTINFGK